MMKFELRWYFPTIVTVALLALGGCDGSEPDASEPVNTTVEQSASGQLPDGHPPLPVSNDMALPSVAPEAGTGAAGLTWATPGGWPPETPASSMRRAQYRVPGDAGDGQCVVFYFGPGQGGDVESNVNRWADEFGQPDGRSSRDLVERRQLDTANVPVTVVEVTGIHSGGMSPTAGGQKKEGQMLLGAIASGPDANWFFKCTGPEETMRAQTTAFEGMLRSIQSGSGS